MFLVCVCATPALRMPTRTRRWFQLTQRNSRHSIWYSSLALPQEIRWVGQAQPGGGEVNEEGNDSCLAAGRNPFSVHHAAAFRLTQSYVFHFFVTHFHLHLYIFFPCKHYFFLYVVSGLGFFCFTFGHETILSGASWVLCAAKYATHYLLCISACPCVPRASCLASACLPHCPRHVI